MSVEVRDCRDVVLQENHENSRDINKCNENIWKEDDSQRELSSLFGHIMTRGKLEYTMTMGKLEGKRGSGRPREKMLDNLASWYGGPSVSETSYDST